MYFCTENFKYFSGIFILTIYTHIALYSEHFMRQHVTDVALFPVIVVVTYVSFPQIFLPK